MEGAWAAGVLEPQQRRWRRQEQVSVQGLSYLLTLMTPQCQIMGGPPLWAFRDQLLPVTVTEE